MFGILSAFHTKQIWLALTAVGIGLLFMMTRPVVVDIPNIPEGNDLYSIESQISPIAFELLNEKLQGSAFYTEPASRDSADSQGIGTGQEASSSTTESAFDPVLRAITFSKGEGTAYFALGDETITFRTGDILEDWTIIEIDASSVLFMKDDEMRRMYMFESLFADGE